MTSGRPRRLLGPTVAAAVVLGISAFVIWAIALWAAWAGACPQPGQSDSGLSKGVEVWPPAAQCVDRGNGTFWHQALPWAPWAIAVLIVVAAAILLTGLVAAIRDLRRPATASTPQAVPLLQASLAGGGSSGGGPAAGRDVGGDEDSSPAIAA